MAVLQVLNLPVFGDVAYLVLCGWCCVDGCVDGVVQMVLCSWWFVDGDVLMMLC